MNDQPRYTAFEGRSLIAAGTPGQVALAVKAALERNGGQAVLTFDDRTGRSVDFDLRGSDQEIAARLGGGGEGASAQAPRSPGRPKLGVVAREVTLLPRHWDWLSAQPGGASVTLRRLVDAARTTGAGPERIRQAQAAADAFMSTMLGDQPGYEEASRALYARDVGRFQQLTRPWPADLRDHARQLAAPAFEA